MHDYMYDINALIHKAQQSKSRAVEVYASELDDFLSTAKMSPSTQSFVDKTIESLYEIVEEMEEYES